jgi:4-diphosphocytidyl-2-C-methyl-D-erythritol kinase
LAAPERLVDTAPAKVNLTLRVLGRRPDGYHDLESLVVFAEVGDALSFAPDGELALTVGGPGAARAGEAADNLVVKAALALAACVPGLRLGTFHLDKRLPVAAGLGGGSADAAAALRLLARANGIAVYDVRLFEAARATGADVPVCLDPRPRIMRGIGDVLSAPLMLPPLPAVLVNPGTALSTKSVFLRWTAAAEPAALDVSKFSATPSRDECLQLLALYGNDLEPAAIALEPTIADVLAALRALPGCRLARMSGSGATCFALFAAAAAAIDGAQALAAAHPRWWVRATALGGVSSA